MTSLPSLSFFRRLGGRHFTGDHNAVGRCKRLAGNTDRPRIDLRLHGFAIDQIDDFIGDTVANLVRMAFGDGLAGEEIAAAHAGIPSSDFDVVIQFVGERQAHKDIRMSLWSRISEHSTPPGNHHAQRKRAACPPPFYPYQSGKDHSTSISAASALTRSTSLRRTLGSLIFTKARLSCRPSEDDEIDHVVGARCLGKAGLSIRLLARRVLEEGDGVALRMLEMFCRRLAPTRFVPFSYF